VQYCSGVFRMPTGTQLLFTLHVSVNSLEGIKDILMPLSF
jgi:hypothetical protein